MADKGNMVAVNAIIRERLVKENRAFRLRETFTLNPKVMDTMPSKPNLVIRGEMPPEIAKKQGLTLQKVDEETIRSLESILFQQNSVPRDKFAQPMTTQQEIGWFVDDPRQSRPRLRFGIKPNEITKFAEAYSVTWGHSPFHSKPAAPH